MNTEKMKDEHHRYHANTWYAKKFLRTEVNKYCKKSSAHSQKKLAAILQVSEGTLSRQLNPVEENFPTLDSVCRLMEILNLSPNAVFDYKNANSLSLNVDGLSSKEAEIVKKTAEALIACLRERSCAKTQQFLRKLS